MGNSQNKLKKFNLVKSQWIPTSNQNELRNIISNELAIIVIKTQLQEHDFNSYLLRHENRQYLPDFKGVIIQDQQNNKPKSILKCSQQNFYKILLEPIVFKLSDLGSIQLKDGLHILKQVFEGYRVLSQKYGKFQIFEDTIGFTHGGRCKLWTHSNFYFEGIEEPIKMKRADFDKISQRSDEESNPESIIFQLIQDRIRSSPEFENYCQNKQKILGKPSSIHLFESHINMEKAIQFINKQIKNNNIDCKTYRIQLPEYQQILQQNNLPTQKDQEIRYNSLTSKARKPSILNCKADNNKLSLKKYNYLSNQRLKLPVIYKNSQIKPKIKWQKRKSVPDEKPYQEKIITESFTETLNNPQSQYFTNVKPKKQTLLQKQPKKRYSSPTNFINQYGNSNRKQLVHFHYDPIA